MIEIIPTNTCPPTLEEMQRRAATMDFAEWMQLDVSDGAFTPELSYPYSEKGIFTEVSLDGVALQTEVHLMVSMPREVGTAFVRAGARRILGHVESFSDTTEAVVALEEWKKGGAEAGLAMLLDTPLEVIEPLIPHCDSVQIMAIAQIGKQGFAFEPRSIDKVRALHANFPDLTIAVDGGVSQENIALLVQAGATRFGVGSAILKKDDPVSAYHSLKATAESALQ